MYEKLEWQIIRYILALVLYIFLHKYIINPVKIQHCTT